MSETQYFGRASPSGIFLKSQNQNAKPEPALYPRRANQWDFERNPTPTLLPAVAKQGGFR